MEKAAAMNLKLLKLDNKMNQMIRIELKRAFCNVRFLYSILVGLLIAGSQIFTWVIPAMEKADYYLLGKGEYPVSVFNTWIGASGHTYQLTLYFIILPVISCLPFSDSCFIERESGYQAHILTRVNRNAYLFSKSIAVYLSGGCAVVLPLVVNLYVTMMAIPSVLPEASSRTFPIFEHSMWSGIFYTHPYVYLGGYFVIIFSYAGLFSLFGMISSFYVRNRFVSLVIPFIVYTLVNFVLGYTEYYKYSPELFLRPDQPAGAVFSSIVMFYIFGLLICMILLVREGKKYDLYV